MAAPATTTTSTAAATSSAAGVSKAWDSSFIANYDAVLFDCDGVLWSGPKLFPGAVDTIIKLRKLGKRVMFVTNNSSQSRAMYVTKLNQFGFQSTIDEVLASSYAVAYYLRHVVDSKQFDHTRQKAFVIGDVGISAELKEAGVGCIEARQKFGKEHLPPVQIAGMEIDPTIGAVVVGIDNEFTYTKAAYALMCLNREKIEATRASLAAEKAAAAAADAKGTATPAATTSAAHAHTAASSSSQCLFISTNQDSTVPILEILLPGGGSCVGMLKTAAGREPINMGKPEPLLMEIALKRFNLDRRRTLMVGDRLDTDIAFGNRTGVDTLMVLTGVSTKEEAAACADTKPTFLAPAIANLLA